MYHYKLNYKLNVTTIFAFCAQKLQNENLEKLVIESKQEVLLLELYIASIVCVCVCVGGVYWCMCVCVCMFTISVRDISDMYGGLTATAANPAESVHA